MTDLVTVTLDEVEVRGPYEKKDGTGSYDRHVFLSDGKEYFQFAKTNQEPKFSKGDTVQLLVESQGKTNKIIRGNKVDGNTVDVDEPETTLIKPQAKPTKATYTKAPPQKTTTTTGGTARDISIARMNAVTSAIALLVHNSTSTIPLAEVKEVAEQIIAYTMEPHNS